MPGGKKAGTANDKQYEALKKKGFPKQSAAKITNVRRRRGKGQGK